MYLADNLLSIVERGRNLVYRSVLLVFGVILFMRTCQINFIALKGIMSKLRGLWLVNIIILTQLYDLLFL